jgi:antibiotic biosynthesis monooxygenase (ABM) superfamily enzyme
MNAAQKATSQSIDESVSVLIRRHVRRGYENAYEELLKGLLSDAEKFDGYRSTDVIRPPSSRDEYEVRLHFRDRDSLRAWMQSRQRLRWQGAMNALADEPQIKVLSGLETWFTVPGYKHSAPPPRWKMTIVTWLAIYPSVLIFSTLVRRSPYQLGGPLSALIVTLITVPLASYVLLPRLTRLFEGWLFRRGR